MKINNILYRVLLSLTACMLIGVMSGCREENASTIGVVRTVRLSVNVADNGDGQTRATMTETDGTLTSSWETGDKLLVTDASGKNLGVLTLKSTVPAPGSENDQADSSESNPTVRFEGDITTSDTGTVTYNFFHIPSGHISSGSLSSLSAVKESLVLDYSRQEGTMEWIRSHDIFSGQAKVVFTTAEEGEGTSEETAQSETVILSRPISFAHFTLTFPEGISASSDTEVKISGSGIYTTLNVSLGEHSYSVGTALGGGSGSAPGSGSGTGVITTRGVDIYLAILIPDGAEQIAPLFTAIINGEEYTGQLSARQWEAGTFVREGHGKGVSVTMEGESDEEDPDNPLTKFAKTNLIRTSERGSSDITNGFADSETDPGALFQWGRNYGFMPMRSADLTGFNLPEDFIDAADGQYPYSHWLDAFGKITDDEYKVNPSKAEYLLYNPLESGQEIVYFSGSGAHSTVYGDMGDIPTYFSESVDGPNHAISNAPTKYILWARPNESLQDYWVQKVEGMDNDTGWTWDERAGYGNYQPLNETIEGETVWRLPTKEEFKEILPEFDYERNGALSDYLNKPELRESNGVSYVITWELASSGLMIKARVVNSGFTLDQVTTDFWNGKKVVSRLFPFTGQITPARGEETQTSPASKYVLPYYSNQNVDVKPVSLGSSRYTVSIQPADENPSKLLGAYWTGDGKGSFQFSSSEYTGTVIVNGASANGDHIKLSDDHPVNAYAIRPVRDGNK